jgi:hypothetical protein
MNTSRQEQFDIIMVICEEAINIKSDYKLVDDASQALTDTGVDSLDFITVFIYMGDIWGISDDDFNNHPDISPEPPRPLLIEDILNCINEVHTLDPTKDEAINQVL